MNPSLINGRCQFSWKPFINPGLALLWASGDHGIIPMLSERNLLTIYRTWIPLLNVQGRRFAQWLKSLGNRDCLTQQHRSASADRLAMPIPWFTGSGDPEIYPLQISTRKFIPDVPEVVKPQCSPKSIPSKPSIFPRQVADAISCPWPHEAAAKQQGLLHTEDPSTCEAQHLLGIRTNGQNLLQSLGADHHSGPIARPGHGPTGDGGLSACAAKISMSH